MNKTVAEAKKLVDELMPLVGSVSDVDIVLCAPFTCLESVSKLIAGSDVSLGAQNMHFEPKGAFTGEISVEMLKEFGVKYVILGHSERRACFAETDDSINKKIRVALACEITPIVCVGETLSQREEGKTKDVLVSQVRAAFEGLSSDSAACAVIAYEPVWAIGTGKTATYEQANDGCKCIRNTVAELFGGSCADSMRIQYGGSMNASNAAALLEQPDIDGGLIGGASLSADDFAKIVCSASKSAQ